MTAATHAVTGAVSGYLVTGDLAGLAAGAIGGLLPDIDTPESFIGRRTWIIPRLPWPGGHRGITHSLLACVALGVLGAKHGGVWAALATGWAVHVALDSVNPAGVMLFWPWKRRVSLALPGWLLGEDVRKLFGVRGLVEIYLYIAGLAGTGYAIASADVPYVSKVVYYIGGVLALPILYVQSAVETLTKEFTLGTIAGLIFTAPIAFGVLSFVLIFGWGLLLDPVTGGRSNIFKAHLRLDEDKPSTPPAAKKPAIEDPYEYLGIKPEGR